jgi:hypothetical protein
MVYAHPDKFSVTAPGGMASSMGKFGRVLQVVRLSLHCSPDMRFCSSSNFPKTLERGWYTLWLHSFSGLGTRRPSWRPLSWCVLYYHLCRLFVDAVWGRHVFSRTRAYACSNMTSAVSLQAPPRCMHFKRSGFLLRSSGHVVFIHPQLSDTYKVWQRKVEQPGNAKFNPQSRSYTSRFAHQETYDY